MLSRRKFLRSSALFSLAPLLPSILARTARAAGAAPDARALVVIQLDGGNDGLNTVVPYADDGYAKARVKLRLEVNKLHKLDDHAALHPSMRAAKELFDDGRLAIVHGVGYPNPNRSHFESMKIWHTARALDAQGDGNGWLGRTLDRMPADVKQKPATAIFVGQQDPPVALWGRKSETIALSDEDDLKLQLAIPPPRAGSEKTAEAGSLDQFVAREVLSAYSAAQDFGERRARAAGARAAGAGAEKYPDTQLATQLKLISQLLQGDSQARVYYAIQSGYDTHSSQLYPHGQLLRELAEGMKAFLNDLKRAGLDDRVVVLAFSEFGRRVAENDSQGTDHGTAGPVFVAGQPVKAGLIGAAPNLADLQDGDLKTQHDFRQVYATLLDDWLGVSSGEVLGAKFERLQILRG
ncbi:MAG TPA: DUF1501 domain-containing protein [Pirellulales bacterium]